MRAFILLTILLPALTLGQMPGGIEIITLSLTDDVVLFAEEQIQKDLVLDNGQPATLEGIVQARRQVTNMMNYYLKLDMSGNYICDVNVTDNWQTDRFEVSGGPECQHQPAARQAMPGSISDPKPLSSVVGTDVEDQVLDGLDAAVCAVSEQHDLGKAFKIVDTTMVNYTSQVTAGTTYRFHNVPLVLTTCSRDVCDRQALAQCAAHPQPTIEVCDLRVQYAPWKNPAYEVYSNDLAQLPACLDL